MRKECTLKGHTAPVNAVAISRTGKFITSGSEDKKVKKWDLQEDILNKTNEFFITSDSRFQVSYTNQSINEVVDLDFSPPKKVLCSLSPKSATDPYYQNKIDYYNVLDAIINNNYSHVSPYNSEIVFSMYSYTLTHVLCFLDKSTDLKALLNPNWVLRSDIFGKSPFYYAITKKFQTCVDILLEYLNNLCENNHFVQFFASVHAIKNDFSLIVANSSKNLIKLLENLLITSSVIFINVSEKLPIYRLMEVPKSTIHDFISFNSELANTEPVLILSTAIPLPTETGAKKTIELLEAIVNAKNNLIFRTPFIQNFIQFH